MEMKNNNEGGDTQSRSGSGSGSKWPNLTLECLTNILSRLTLEQLWLGPMLVCKPWHRACKDPSLHTVFDVNRYFPIFDSPRYWSPDFERKMDSMLHSVVDWSDASLTTIRTRYCSNGSLLFAAQRCRNLEVLSIKFCRNVTDALMAEIAFQCPKLRELDISCCCKISHKSLVSIGTNCPKLKVLKRNLMNCACCPRDGDPEAAAIGKSMPYLEHLEIQCSKLSAMGLSLICEGCVNLKYLDLSGCTSLTSQDIANASSNLKDLDIKKPNIYIPKVSQSPGEVWHSRLYDERLQTDVYGFDQTGDSRFEGRERVRYTRDQLLQLREAVEVPDDILKIKREIEAEINGEDQTWGRGESNPPNLPQVRYTEPDNRDWRGWSAQFPNSGESREVGGRFDSRQQEDNQLNSQFSRARISSNQGVKAKTITEILSEVERNLGLRPGATASMRTNRITSGSQGNTSPGGYP